MPTTLTIPAGLRPGVAAALRAAAELVERGGLHVLDAISVAVFGDPNRIDTAFETGADGWTAHENVAFWAVAAVDEHLGLPETTGISDAVATWGTTRGRDPKQAAQALRDTAGALTQAAS